MDRKLKKEFLIIAIGLLVLLSCMSFLLRSCSDQKAKQAQQKQRVSTQQKMRQDKKEESTEKSDIRNEEEKKEDNKLRDLDGNEIKNDNVPQKGVQ